MAEHIPTSFYHYLINNAHYVQMNGIGTRTTVASDYVSVSMNVLKSNLLLSGEKLPLLNRGYLDWILDWNTLSNHNIQ